MTPELNWLRPELPITAGGALNLQGTMEIVLHRIQEGERQHVCRQREDEDDKDRELVELKKENCCVLFQGRVKTEWSFQIWLEVLYKHRPAPITLNFFKKDSHQPRLEKHISGWVLIRNQLYDTRLYVTEQIKSPINLTFTKWLLKPRKKENFQANSNTFLH